MTTVTITNATDPNDGDLYRAKANGHHALGRTVGEALDGLGPHLAAAGGTIVVLLQKLGGDEFFGTAQLARLNELMGQWRKSRDADGSLAPGEQQELDALIDLEIEASARRAAALADLLPR